MLPPPPPPDPVRPDPRPEPEPDSDTSSFEYEWRPLILARICARPATPPPSITPLAARMRNLSILRPFKYQYCDESRESWDDGG